ncbi:hypothetical protein [Gillisia sp. CAL575]|uniref:hypothetical protein n=1 Tax=Gillisia sp. CAL575 TaxID=985255 RepID=UPI0003A3BAC5|nr:hypothetical protein [Gillisia sp. CAL575]
MAEIKITKKSPVWPWILLVLIIIGGLFFLFFYGNTDEDEFTDDNETEFEEVTSTNLQYNNLVSLEISEEA